MIERYIKRISKDTAVYWASPTSRTDGSNAYATPVEISCFWLNETELTSTQDGKEVYIVAKVFVSQDLDEQGMLFQGCLSDLTAAQKADPRKVRRAYEIRRMSKLPSRHLKNAFNRCAMISPRLAR